MFNYFAIAALLFGALSAQAQQTITTAPQDKTQASPRLSPDQRTTNLTDQMVRDLHLNGYQSSRVQAINATQTTKMVDITKKNAGNQKLIDQQCDAVCKQRDQKLRAVLSNDQYTDYYGRRSIYNQFAQNYAKQAATNEFVKSVQEPAPASSRGAVIKPTRAATDEKPASTNVRGR